MSEPGKLHPGGFGAVPIALMRDKRATASHVSCYAALSSTLGYQSGEGPARTRRLSERAHLRPETVTRCLSNLAEWGYVSIEERSGAPPIYTLRATAGREGDEERAEDAELADPRRSGSRGAAAVDRDALGRFRKRGSPPPTGVPPSDGGPPVRERGSPPPTGRGSPGERGVLLRGFRDSSEQGGPQEEDDEEPDPILGDVLVANADKLAKAHRHWSAAVEPSFLRGLVHRHGRAVVNAALGEIRLRGGPRKDSPRAYLVSLCREFAAEAEREGMAT